MRPLTSAVLALALAAGASVALADPQNGDNHGDHNGGHNEHHAGAGQGGQGGQGGQQGRHVEGVVVGQQHFNVQGQGVGPGGGQGAPQYRRYQGQGVVVGQQFGGQGGGQPGGPGPGPLHRHLEGAIGGPQFNGVQAGGQGFQGGGQGFQGGGQRAAGFQFHQHNLRDRDEGRDWFRQGAFPHEFAAHRRFRDNDYDFPRGWYYRTWYYGDFLPWGWYTPAYYLDWSYFDLPEAPIGCEWIREGHDAILVDIWTGEVLSVYRDLFW